MTSGLKIATATGGIFLFIGAIVIIGPFSVLCGFASGWIVDQFWHELFRRALDRIGLASFSLPQVSAVLSFFSSFLRTRTEVKTKKDKG